MIIATMLAGLILFGAAPAAGLIGIELPELNFAAVKASAAMTIAKKPKTHRTALRFMIRHLPCQKLKYTNTDSELRQRNAQVNAAAQRTIFTTPILLLFL